MPAERTAIGIDIGDGAWAIVELAIGSDQQGRTPNATRIPFGSLHAGIRPDAIAIIDAPIGLLDNEDASPTDKGKSGDRDVDKGARKWCPSTSSVFPPPTQQQLASAIEEHRRAAVGTTKEAKRRRLGNVEPGGMSQQTFELAPAVEAARLLKAEFPEQVFEGHPEVVFSALAKGVLPLPKLSLAGALVRAGLLRERLEIDVVDWVIRQESSTGVAADNWLDALAMAIVAADWAQGTRFVLKTRDGLVHSWAGEADGIMALPILDLKAPPPRFERERAIRLASSGAAIPTEKGERR